MDASMTGIIVIVVMGLVVYATRIAGSEFMSLFEMTPCLEAVLKSMASSVLVAIVVSECARGSFRVSAAVLAAAVTMLVLKNPLLALSSGVVTAAAFSFMHG